MWAGNARKVVHALADAGFGKEIIRKKTRDVLYVDEDEVLITVLPPENVVVTEEIGPSASFSYSDSTTLYEWMNDENCQPLTGTPIEKTLDRVGECDNISWYQTEADSVEAKQSEWDAAGELYAACYPRVFYQFNEDTVSLNPTLDSQARLVGRKVRVLSQFYISNGKTFGNDTVSVVLKKMSAQCGDIDCTKYSTRSNIED